MSFAVLGIVMTVVRLIDSLVGENVVYVAKYARDFDITTTMLSVDYKFQRQNNFSLFWSEYTQKHDMYSKRQS